MLQSWYKNPMLIKSNNFDAVYRPKSFARLKNNQSKYKTLYVHSNTVDLWKRNSYWKSFGLKQEVTSIMHFSDNASSLAQNDNLGLRFILSPHCWNLWSANSLNWGKIGKMLVQCTVLYTTLFSILCLQLLASLVRCNPTWMFWVSEMQMYCFHRRGESISLAGNLRRNFFSWQNF